MIRSFWIQTKNESKRDNTLREYMGIKSNLKFTCSSVVTIYCMTSFQIQCYKYFCFTALLCCVLCFLGSYREILRSYILLQYSRKTILSKQSFFLPLYRTKLTTNANLYALRNDTRKRFLERKRAFNLYSSMRIEKYVGIYRIGWKANNKGTWIMKVSAACCILLSRSLGTNKKFWDAANFSLKLPRLSATFSKVANARVFAKECSV